jgi:hypothetical protein
MFVDRFRSLAPSLAFVVLLASCSSGLQGVPFEERSAADNMTSYALTR